MRKSNRFRVQAVLVASAVGIITAAQSASAQSASAQTLSYAATQYQVFAFNDLGMHCYDTDFSVFSLLPPFNVVHAQVVAKGPRPRLCDDSEIVCGYSATYDPRGSINRTSIGKTNFWQYAYALYGADLDKDEGILGADMPGARNSRQPMPFDQFMQAYSAVGIPVTNLDDRHKMNPYPMMKVQALRKKTIPVNSLDIVVPASSEMGCVSCHVTGQDGASDWHAATYNVTFSKNGNPTIQYRENILLLHDGIQGTNLFDNRPVLCAGCHYSKALDLDGTGEKESQKGHVYLSRAVHGHHGRTLGHQVPGDGNADPAILPEDGANSCYSCHPGTVTNCLRGVMSGAQIVCQDCHGGMLALAGQFADQCGQSARRPWTDLPKCQSCHTGDAVDHLGTTFRCRQTYSDSDPTCTSIVAVNPRFAENDGRLYRFSAGHGGMACAACHGSPHAEWPSHSTSPNDNVTATQIQGHTGPIIECRSCHAGAMPASLNGPHGLHAVNDATWIKGHKDAASPSTACAPCHNLDLRGTALSVAAADRRLTYMYHGKTKSVVIKRGTQVACTTCHAVSTP